jgi:hypothetical protein
VDFGNPRRILRQWWSLPGTTGRDLSASLGTDFLELNFIRYGKGHGKSQVYVFTAYMYLPAP